MLGSFTLKVSDQAERLQYEALPTEVRRQLVRGLTFDPDQHDIYQFLIVPVFRINLEAGAKAPRKLKKQGYEQVDRALVQILRGSPRIHFLGMHPVSELENGQLGLDIEREALFEAGVPKVLRLQGRIKDALRRKVKPRVLAARTDDLVQWIFLKSWLAAGGELGMRILCAVPRDLPLTERYAVCSAEFAQGRRTIEAAPRKRIPIPPPAA